MPWSFSLIEEDANVPVPQLSDSDLPESDDDDYDGFSEDGHGDPPPSDEGTATSDEGVALESSGQPSFGGEGVSEPGSIDEHFFLGAMDILCEKERDEEEVTVNVGAQADEDGDEWGEEALQLGEGKVVQVVVGKDWAQAEAVLQTSLTQCGNFLIQTHR